MTSNTFEIRSGGDLRAVSPNKLSGYAAVFNKLSHDLGGFVEQIRAGAFTKSLRENAPVRALYEHDDQRILGSTRSGTLKLSEDAKGLRFELDLPATTYAQDLAVLVERGDIAGMSFGFVVPSGGDNWEVRSGVLTRDLIDIRLSEITVTANPAYPDTEVAKRSMNTYLLNEYLDTPSMWIQTCG
ncbi:HK97 family phage prohead protease [Massilia sp. CCM 8695]|uniref:HK97 family phage prohead protease n=1 Tax=Massilia frigida TaxID=2609281 RepID=A0ABX0NJA3_9BURK|nr:HK97 family phage prohead protease [Massilia frigida]NHZ83946.1 HK97 family phage prohead protease [Massilia frigida]